MEPTYASAENIDDVVEGAVIQRLEIVDSGARIFLQDGRYIFLPSAEKFFVCTTVDILQ